MKFTPQIPACVKWYTIVIFVSISLLIGGFEYLSLCSLDIDILSTDRYPCYHFACLQLNCCADDDRDDRIEGIYLVRELTPYQTIDLHISSPFYRLLIFEYFISSVRQIFEYVSLAFFCLVYAFSITSSIIKLRVWDLKFKGLLWIDLFT